jgi:hypothetical protein
VIRFVGGVPQSRLPLLCGPLDRKAFPIATSAFSAIMDDVKKRSSGYAESQVRVLLADLNKADGTHNSKVVAVKRFSDYIMKYRPEVSVADRSSSDRLSLLRVLYRYMTMMSITYFAASRHWIQMPPQTDCFTGVGRAVPSMTESLSEFVHLSSRC